MISVRNLGKRFGELRVFRGLNLDVKKGEVAVLVGPSGVGKSTFLRCLNGLETFDEGQFELDGIKVDAALAPRDRHEQIREVRRRVGMVFQQFHLFPHRTVLGNVIEAPVQVLGRPRDEAVADARKLLDRVGLGDKLNNMPDTLSGGQQQRVAIARALAMNPLAILFDEPTSALDPRMAGEVEAVMADLAKSGQTMVVVTHHIGFARRAANLVHVMAAEGIVESGPPDEVFDRPRHAATKALLSDNGGR